MDNGHVQVLGKNISSAGLGIYDGAFRLIKGEIHLPLLRETFSVVTYEQGTGGNKTSHCLKTDQLQGVGEMGEGGQRHQVPVTRQGSPGGDVQRGDCSSQHWSADHRSSHQERKELYLREAMDVN